MKLLLLFVLASVGGGLGKIAGILLGAAIGPGVGILLQFVLGSAVLAVAVLAAERLGAIKPFQRGWSILAGVLGVGMATFVTLSTLSSPVAPYVIPALMGMGAALGSLVGKSAHERPDLT